MKTHIEYDDFGEYIEAMEDLLFSDRKGSEGTGSGNPEKVIPFCEKWDKHFSRRGA